ncbi:MAG: tyrosine/phenylalanine carboxypeptidase domain-containing protein [Candidatus Magasanikbacteria bacterium]
MGLIQKVHGILGMNARNLQYVGRYNTDESKRFADDKMFTKNYLMVRGFGVAKVYAVLKRHNDLKTLNPKSLPEKFVIKPNRGYGGEGIIVISQHKGNDFFGVDGAQYTWTELYHHMVSIIDGKYAISGLFDQVIIEELLVPHEYFKSFIESGLPDIRIIVFNFVPIIAMLRLPTIESHGKANLHLGAIGAGIDIVTGKATYAVYHNRFIQKLPNGKKVREIEMPEWDTILLAAARAQQASQIKFLAVDLSLTTNGIKVLELNARAGLGIQIANQIPLKHRLKKIEDLKIPNPEKGVEVSKALFSSISEKEKTEKDDTARKVVGLYEDIEILNTPYTHIRAKIDPHGEKVVFDSSLTYLDPSERFADVLIRGERVRFPFKMQDIEGTYQAIIGGKALYGFLIDPQSAQSKSSEESHIATQAKRREVNEKIVKNIDKKLCEIDKELNVLAYIKPLNFVEAKEQFLQRPIASPKFVYRRPSFDLEKMLREIDALPRDIDHALMPLFVRKIEEMITKLEFIDEVGTEDFPHASEKLYGNVSEDLYNQAKAFIDEHPLTEDTSKVLGTRAILKRLRTFLDTHNLNSWRVVTSSTQAADIAVNKYGTIFVRSQVKMSENRLSAAIMHEICTHIYRLENGKLQSFQIFEQGTAHYLETEEGLAVYNQRHLGLPLGEKEQRVGIRIIAAYHAQTMSFVELFNYMKKEYVLDDESAWTTCVRAKRGISDTSRAGASTRDLIYFRGYTKVREYLSESLQEGMKILYTGKLSLEDIPLLAHMNTQPAKFMPPDNIEI